MDTTHVSAVGHVHRSQPGITKHV